MLLELNEAELELVRRLVVSEIEDLRVEVHHTHESDMKEELRKKEHRLQSLLEKVEAAAKPPA